MWTLTPRAVILLLVLFLTVFFVSVTLTAPRWARVFREPLLATGSEAPAGAGSTAAGDAKTTPPVSQAQRTITVKLFFEAADRGGLVLEERNVPFSSDLGQQLRVVVEELVRGSNGGLLPPLNPATRVRDVFLSAGGVAYVDLSSDVAKGSAGGTDAELLSVYAIVNSLAENFPAVKRVQILIEDRPAETLAGHVDLSRPLSPDLTLLAAAAVEPAAPASPPS
jgi:hypothetical protein